MIGLAERARREDPDAAAACDEILTGPSSWWQTRLRQKRDSYTAGLVATLLERMRGVLDSSPADALQITTLAIEVANELDVAAYPSGAVIRLRAEASHDHACVLVTLGRIRQAAGAATRARRLFAHVSQAECDGACLDLVEAAILAGMERIGEAVEHVRRAAGTFERLGDRMRCVDARMHEGELLYAAGQVLAALDVWSAIDGDPDLGDLRQLRLLHNIASCHVRVGRPELGVPILQRCVAGFETLGMETERTRGRGFLAQALAASGHHREAIPLLRQTWSEFERLGLVMDAARAALELAGQLLFVGESAEIAAICRDLVAKFTRAGMPTRTITALAFAHAAADTGQITAAMIRSVHEFLGEVPDELRDVFAPPLTGAEGSGSGTS